MRWLVPLLALLGCASDDVVVATLVDAPSTDGGTEEGGTDAQVAPGCRTQADCSAASFCSRTACDDLLGTCVPRPTLCAPEPGPVCGCDGVTYFNDCLRRQSGVSARRDGDCQGDQALRCGGADDRACPSGSYCARLLFGDAECTQAAEGRCWVIPACDDSARLGDLFAPCGRTPSAGDDACVDACTAIASELPHKRMFRCRTLRELGDDPRHTGTAP